VSRKHPQTPEGSEIPTVADSFNLVPNEAVAQLQAWLQQGQSFKDWMAEGERLAALLSAPISVANLTPSVTAAPQPPVAPPAAPAREPSTAPQPPTPERPKRRPPRPAEKVRVTPEGKYVVDKGQGYARVAAEYFGDREFEVMEGLKEAGPHIEGYTGHYKQRDSWRRSLANDKQFLDPVPGKPGWYRRRGGTRPDAQQVELGEQE
jgi:hypothetical protein